MAIQEVKITHTANPDAVEDPKIIKVAKLALIFADTSIDADTRLCCVRLAIRNGYITEEEGKQFLLYRAELEEMMANAKEEE